MKFYYDDNRGTDQFSLQDFEPSFGAKMGAAFDESWLEGYWSTTSAKRRLSEAANVGAKLSASEVKSRIDASGLRVNIAPKDGEYTDAQISVILERQRELTKAKDVRERTPWDLGSPLRGVAMFGAGIADPINLATAFFPWTRLVGGMRGIRAATESASAVTRFGARAALGAADAGISTAAIEPFYYGMRQSLGDDYTAVDSMANIAFGAAFGGGIHSIGGVGVDMFRRAMGMQQPWQTNVAPAVTGDAIIPPPASMLMGRDVSVRVGDQYEPGQWAVVDADTLTATVDKADNQFRDRGRAAYQAEITARANALDPALVLSVDTPLMDVGTPTIAADGRIIGGNGRTLFIQRAYEIGKAGDYRAELERRLSDLGIDPEAVRGMNRPVLVRRLSRNVDVKRAAMLSNEGGSTAMSPLEQAKVDSERLGDVQLETDADGNLDTAGNRAAIRRWVNEQPEGQRNALMTEDGRLSASGLQRLRNAVLFKAYGDSPTLARLIEATDVGSRNVAAALARTAGVVADAEGSISRGELHPLSIAADIRMAVEQFDNLRRQGMKVADYLAQVDMLGDPLTPEGRLLLDFMSRNIVSSRRIGDAISGYYAKLQEAGNPGQGDMFGGVSPDKMGMLRAATEAVDSEPLNAAETVAIISPDTREAALGTAVGQAIDGRSIDVAAIVNTDPAVGGTSTAADVVASAERNQQPEAMRTADFDAAAAVDRRLATAPKWDALSDAEAASAEAETLLNDTIKAGDQAFKYSRGEAPGQKKATLWQGTTARFAPEEGAPLGRFRWDMINSDAGEGAQAFGYGHYLAQQAWISQTRYRERLLRENKDKLFKYTIPDGAGGVMELSPDSDPAWVLPDGTIVHASQKDPTLAEKAKTIERINRSGYEDVRDTLERVGIASAKRELARIEHGFKPAIVDGEWNILNPDGVPEYRKGKGFETEADAKEAADDYNSGFYRDGKLEKARSRLAKLEADIAALDEVTVEVDTVDKSAAAMFEGMLEKLKAQGDTSSQTYQDVMAGLNAAKPIRILDPNIKKYEPPLPENLRERVVADSGEELRQGILSVVSKLQRDGVLLESGDGLRQTHRLDLQEVQLDVSGRNLRFDLADVIAKLDESVDLRAFNAAEVDQFLSELRGLQDRGAKTVTLERPGSLYRAEMDADVFNNLMLYDAPMSAQPKLVQDVFRKFGIYEKELDWVKRSSISWYTPNASYHIEKHQNGFHLFFGSLGDIGTFATLDEAKSNVPKLGELSGQEAYEQLSRKIYFGKEHSDELGDAIADANFEIADRRFWRSGFDDPLEAMDEAGYRPRADEVASVILSNEGIPGHAFLDGEARANVTWESRDATFNLVIYSDDVAKITDRYARQTGEIKRATDDPDGLTEALRLSFGKSTEALLDRGQIQIVATPADIPGGPHPGDVKAATAPDGTVYMVASNISEADARGLVLHEVGVHVGMEQMLGRDVFQSVLGQLDDAIMRGDDWAQAARDAVPKGTNPAHVREEQLAYLVQNAPDLIAAAKDAGARERLVALYDAILAAVRAWAYRTFEFARERMTLTEADFRAMAVAALHDAVRRGDRAGVGAMAPAGRSVGGLADAYTRGSDQLSEALSEIEALVAKYKDEFPVYFKGSIPDFDRGAARIVEKYWNELSGRTQEFIGPRIARDWETGEQIQAVDSVRGTHIFDLYQELENREFVSGGSVGGAQLFARDGGQTSTPEFRAWFGDSKVVDADGKPLVVYRGSTTDEGSVIRRGWFTSDQRAASLFASKVGLDTPPQSVVTPAFLSIKNPFVVDAKGAYWDEIPFGDPLYGFRYTSEEIAAFARDEGYDGVIIRNVNESDDFLDFENGIDVYVALRPEQIKSATGNVGTFDPANPDIRYSRGSVPDPSTSKDEIKSADEAVKRAKSYASVLRAAADKLENDAEATAAMRAALPDITPQEIDDLLGQLRKQVTGLRSMARATRSMLDAEDTAAGMQDEAMRAADMLANNLQMAAVIEKRNAALNLNVRLKASSFVNQFRDKGLDFEGFAALLTGSQRVRSGARLSVDAEYKGFRGEWMGGMIADIEKLGLWREFVDGAFDRDIYDALHRLGTESPDFTGLPKEAVELAKVVNKYQTDARNTRNRFGAWIRDLKGYITRQSHDMFKIRDAGEQDWVAYVKERIDVAKMTRLGLISENDPMSSLRTMYDDFAAGVHMKAAAGEDDTAAFGVGSNLAKRESVSRVLYFKDGIAAFEYNERFGQGRLADSVLSGLEASARSSALLKTLGTNPEATLTRLLNEYENSLVGDPARRSKFRAQRGAIMNMLAQVDGSTLIPGNVTAAKVGTFVRAWTAMTRLGGALISSFTDLAGYGAELRYQGNKNLFSGVLDGIGRATQGRAKGEQRQVLASLGVFHESVIGAVAARFDSPELTGRMAWGMQQFFKWNGLNWWTESLRDGAALSHSHYLAQNAGKSFDKLDGELQRLLSLYNIDAGKWDLLRLGTMKMADGRAYMTPDALATVPRAALENYIQLAGRTVNDATVQNLLDDLSQVLRVMSVDRAHHAVLEPNARARTWMVRGTKPGTVPGEVLRYIGQFKSFSVAMIQMVLGREIYGRGYDTLGEYLKKGKGDMLGLATMIGLYTAFGYAAMSIKDMLKGREPRPVDDPRTWYAAMAQGGGLGLYGDFLFGEYSRMGRTFTASLAGPVIGNLDTLADLMTRARNGDDMAGSAFKALLDNTPFMNLFYLRPVLDYLVLYQIQEALNPGFLRRMEGRIMRDNSQEFIFPPSQYARGV